MNIIETLKFYMSVLERRKTKFEVYVGDLSVYRIVEQPNNHEKTIYEIEGIDSNGNQSVLITDYFYPIIKVVKDGPGRIPTFSDKLE